MPSFGDSRGYFNELYNDTKYDESLVQKWRQVSFSKSARNVMRGLHCSPYGKFITCTRGKFYDVIADFREDSPTFGRWCGVMLTEENQKQVYVPARCGHGFYTFEDDTCALYLQVRAARARAARRPHPSQRGPPRAQEGTFDPANEADTHPDDPFINVQWPVRRSPRVRTMRRFPRAAHPRTSTAPPADDPKWRHFTGSRGRGADQVGQGSRRADARRTSATPARRDAARPRPGHRRIGAGL